MIHIPRVAILMILLLPMLLSRASFAADRTTAPSPRDKADVDAALANAPKPTSPPKPIHIMLIAGPKDHGPGEHDYPAFQKAWAPLLTKAPQTKVTTAWEWPTQEQWAGVDVAVCYLRTKWTQQQIDDVNTLQSRGGGVVLVHWAIAADGAGLYDAHKSIVGMTWPRTKYRHGPLDLKLTQPDHPITLGLPNPLKLIDESYWPMDGDASKVTLLATSDEIVPGSTESKPMPMYWTYEPTHGGRAVVCILGHYMWTFDDPFFRLMLMRSIAWSGGRNGDETYRFDELATDPTKTLPGK
jgi:type 1 glutamine amidotransferase